MGVALQRSLPVLVILVALACFAAVPWLASVPLRIEEGSRFRVLPTDVSLYDLKDLGIVDADRDGSLDLFTTNHSAAQVLFRGPLSGALEDVSSAEGLDQQRDVPGLEDAPEAPDAGAPGLHVYWLRERLHALNRADEALELRLQLTVPSGDAGDAAAAERLRIEKSPAAAPRVTVSRVAPAALRLDLTATLGPGERLAVDPDYVEIPVDVAVSGERPVAVYAGRRSVRLDTTPFRLGPLRDRHGMAWADVDGDGVTDVFINRGGMRGHIGQMPGALNDELLVSSGGGRADVAAARGLEKGDCPGYQTAWVDWNGDGLLDLYVSCIRGEPNRLYTQQASGRFRETAAEVGVAIADNSWEWPFVWFDVDGDGDQDLVAGEGRALVLYRQEGGRFAAETLADGLRGVVALAVGDLDGDLDLDVFAASWRESRLLGNESGSLVLQARREDLPARALAATWLDLDNDGRLDLFSVPDGAFMQRSDGRFSATGEGGVSRESVAGALLAAPDMDGDGRRDVILGLQPDLPRWRHYTDPFLRADVPEWRRIERSWPLVRLLNEGESGHWLQVDLAGGAGNADAIGARVELRAGADRWLGQVGLAESSHYSQGHHRVYFGLGAFAAPVDLAVDWPAGGREVFKAVTTDRRVTLRHGEGEAVTAAPTP